MYSIKGTDVDTSIKNYLHSTVVSNLQYGHYYLFHTQFDVFNCYTGRTTVNPFAIAIHKNLYDMDMKNDNFLFFIRTNNKLPGTAYDVLKRCAYEHLYDITDAVNERGLDNVITFLNDSKELLLKSNQECKDAKIVAS